MDLAYREWLLNPERSDPSEIKEIVLIDEIDRLWKMKNSAYRHMTGKIRSR